MKRTRLINQGSGMGGLKMGDRFVSTVNYHIDVYQDFIIAESAGGSHELPGIKSIRGLIGITEVGPRRAEVLQMCSIGEVMILIMEGGKDLGVILIRPYGLGDRFEFRCTGTGSYIESL